jgi:hypothetical protein
MPGAGGERTDFMLLPLGSGYKNENEVLLSHSARWRAGVAALFPVHADSDRGSPLDFGVEADAVWHTDGTSRSGDAAARGGDAVAARRTVIYDVRGIPPPPRAPSACRC